MRSPRTLNAVTLNHRTLPPSFPPATFCRGYLSSSFGAGRPRAGQEREWRKNSTPSCLGGGISGLTAGLLLKQRGLKTAVLEATGRAGGSILTWQQEGFIFELGPNTVLNNALEIDALCDAAGLLESRLKAEPASTKRYIVKEGSLIPLPSGPLGFLATPLFSWGAKMRLLKEPFIGRAPKEVEETIAAFTRRRLGQEFLDYAVGPFVSGVYAGDPARLSVRHATAKIYALEEKYGGLIKGALAKRKGPAPAGGLFSFPKGLETLPLVISGTLGANWRPGRNITTVRKSEGGFVVEALKSGTELETYESRAVVTALPAASVSEILAPLGGIFPDGIASLPYADVAVVCMGFRREDVEHPLDGFGFLAPEVEGRHVSGVPLPLLALSRARAARTGGPHGVRGRGRASGAGPGRLGDHPRQGPERPETPAGVALNSHPDARGNLAPGHPPVRGGPRGLQVRRRIPGAG